MNGRRGRAKLIPLYLKSRKRKGLSYFISAQVGPLPPKKCENCGAIIMTPKLPEGIQVEIGTGKEPVLCQVCKNLQNENLR